MSLPDIQINHPVTLCCQSGTPLLQKEGKLVPLFPAINYAWVDGYELGGCYKGFCLTKHYINLKEDYS